MLAAGKVYTFGRIDDDEVLICFDAVTSKEAWRDGVPTAKIGIPAKGFKGEFVGPRSTPVISGGKICTLGSSGFFTDFTARRIHDGGSR